MAQSHDGNFNTDGKKPPRAYKKIGTNAYSLVTWEGLIKAQGTTDTQRSRSGWRITRSDSLRSLTSDRVDEKCLNDLVAAY